MLGIARADLTDFDVLRRLGGINVPAAVVARGNEVKLLGQIVHRHGLHIAGVVDDDLCQAAAVGGLVTQPGTSLGITLIQPVTLPYLPTLLVLLVMRTRPLTTSAPHR